MESTVQLTIESYEFFKVGNYKQAENILQKIKQQSKRQISRIEENLFLCEYLQNRDQNKSLYLQNLQDLIKNIKSIDSNQQQKKGSQNSLKNISDDIDQKGDFEDDSILKYNYCIMLYFDGQYQLAMQIISELLDRINHLHAYMSQKIALLGLDMAIQKRNEPLIQRILDIVDSQKMVFVKEQILKKQMQNGTENNNSNNHQQSQQSQENGTNNNNGNGTNSQQQQMQQQKLNQRKYYCSVAFGSEIYSQEQPIALCKLEFYFILNIFKTQIFLMYNDFKSAKKTLKLSNKTVQKFIQILQQDQQQQENSNTSKKNNSSNSNGDNQYYYNEQLVGYLQKQCLTIFKYTKSYIAFKEQNYMKALKQLSPNSTVVTDVNSSPGDFYNFQQNFQVYQLNNLGCIHMKLKKYSLAANYFLKGIHICKNQQESLKSLTIHERQIIQLNKAKKQNLVYNLGLCFMFCKKYPEAYDCLSDITQQIYENENMWYRIGCGLTEIYHQKLSEKYDTYDNNIQAEILDNYNLRFSSFPDEIRKMQNSQGKSQRKESEQQQQSQDNQQNNSNNNNNNITKQQQNIYNSLQNYQNFKRYVLHRKNHQNIEEFDNNNSFSLWQEDILQKAVNCFRNCVIIALKKKERMENKFTINIAIDSEIVEKLNKNEEILPENNNNNNNNVQQQQQQQQQQQFEKTGQNHEQKLEQIQKLLGSCYLYMGYLHVLKKEWNNVLINTQKVFVYQNYMTEEDKISNNMYQLEAYIEQGNIKQAQKLQQNLIVSQTYQQQQTQPNQQQACQYGVGPQGGCMVELSPKNIYAINFALLHIKQGDLEKAQNVLTQILQNLEINTNSIQANLPLPLLNLCIYINLKNGNTSNAIQYIRRRRILSLIALNNNKSLLEITK